MILDANGESIGRAWGPLHYWRQTVPLAELQGVQAAVQCTTNEALTVYIDSIVVVRGIRRGPFYRHRRNAYRWKVFWECVGTRRIIPIKIKSHTSRAEAAAAGHGDLEWEGNACADQLADNAAAEAQLPAASVEEVYRIDTLAANVQEHLVAVALEVARRAPALYGPSSRFERRAEAAARAAARRDEAEDALRLTRHRWCSKSLRCLDCFKSPEAGQSRTAFFRTECPKRPHQVHATHTLARHRGLWWCERCGANGHQTFSSLAKRCHAPTEHGKRILRCIRDDRLPAHLSAWPDEAAGVCLSLGTA